MLNLPTFMKSCFRVVKNIVLLKIGKLIFLI
jgi:hypothetical protein